MKSENKVSKKTVWTPASDVTSYKQQLLCKHSCRQLIIHYTLFSQVMYTSALTGDRGQYKSAWYKGVP